MEDASVCDVSSFLAREKAYLSAIALVKREILDAKQAVPAPTQVHETSHGKLKTIYVDPTIGLEIVDLRLKLAERDDEIQSLKNQLNEGTKPRDRGEGRFALAKLRDKLRKLTEENQSFSVLLAERNQPLQLNCSTQQKQDEYWAQQLRTLYELTSELTEEEEQLQQMSHELTVGKCFRCL
eukprot:GHVN01078004.1.p1 GENE.GHVN01078004.1~~GHVN01078004.1.p1  ORF type:complete len:181 (+),score=29.69 GHVN01078004.1:83-625(+)